MGRDGRTDGRRDATRLLGTFLLPMRTRLIGPEVICYYTVCVCVCVCVCIYIYTHTHTHNTRTRAAVTIKLRLWGLMLYILLHIYTRFGSICSLCLQ